MQKFTDVQGTAGARMNLDASPENMPQGMFREIVHMVDDGRGRLVNMKGFENVLTMPVNIESNFTLPTGVFKCVGTARDIEESRILYWLQDTVGTAHSIMQMNVETKALEWVLRDEPLLNLKQRLDADVIEGLSYWTDGYFGSFLNNDFNPPRKINIAKAVKYTAAMMGDNRWDFTRVKDGYAATGIKTFEGMTSYIGTTPYPYGGTESLVAWSLDGINRVKTTSGYGVIWDLRQIGSDYIVTTDRPWQEADTSYDRTGHTLVYEPGMYFGIDWQVMDVIKWKPPAPTVEYGTDTESKTNRLHNNLFQFCTRWVSDDKEKSVVSAISDIPLPSKSETITGVYFDIVKDNVITVHYDTGPMEVTAIEFLYRINNTGAWAIYDRKYKYDQDGNVLLASDVYNTSSFYNNEISEAVDPDDIIRPYDAVPLVAGRQTIIEKNRLVYSDYKEGFDHIDVDAQLSYERIERQVDPNISITPSIVEYPNIPAGNYTGYPLYSLGVTFYRYVSGLLYAKFFAGARLGFKNIPIVPYATYVLTIDTNHFYKYDKLQSEESEWWWNYPDDNRGDFLGGSAVVTLGENDNLQVLLNKFCYALRQIGHSGTESVIAVTGSNAYQNWNNHIWDQWEDQQSGLECSDNEIFLLVGGGNGNATIDLTRFQISIDIISDSNYKYKTFKSGEHKEIGFEYTDRAGRFCFVNSDDLCRILIPFQTDGGYNRPIMQHIIKWEANHIPPDWATTYRIVIRKRIEIPYYVWCPLYGINTGINTGLVLSFPALSVYQNFSVTKQYFSKFNVEGYQWEAGDRVRFVLKGTNTDAGELYTCIGEELDFEIIGIEVPTGEDTYLYDDTNDPILDANGNRVKDTAQTRLLISPYDFGAIGISNSTLETQKIIVEIYRPGKLTKSNEYYQLSESIPIDNPHTADRTHGKPSDGSIAGWNRAQTSVVSARGTIECGDAYLLRRMMQNENFATSFPCESTSYSDWYDSDSIGIGLPNMENRDARFFTYKANLRYGGKLVQDTNINDMSRFTSSDTIELKDKYGTVYSVQEVGDELKIIQKHHTSKLLIGRAGVTQPNEEGTQIISSTKDVLGTLIQTRWDYGTVHPGSVVKNNDRYYFFDFYAQSILRDPGNGLQNLTENFGLKHYMESKCKAFGSADNVDVIGAYDQENQLILWTFTDLTNADNSFSLAFRDTGGSKDDGFVMLGKFVPQEYGWSKKVLTAWSDNALWLMNSDNVARCNFFGTQYKYWFTPVFNKGAITVKRWLQILISSAKKFSAPDAGDVAIPISGNSPAGMVSLLKPAAFSPVNGKMVADFGKNMTTNSLTPSNADLVNGDDLTGQCLTVRLEGSETTEHDVMAVEVNGIAQ